MADFQIVFYIMPAMMALLIAVFSWGFISFMQAKKKSKKVFFNLPLVIGAAAVGLVGLVITLVPIGMQVWTYDNDFLKTDPLFLTLLILEFVFLIAFLSITYIFAFDFGIAHNEEDDKIAFFGQAINANKVENLELKKHSLRIVYLQGQKEVKKRLIVLTPKAKEFVRQSFKGVKTLDLTKPIKKEKE